MHACDNVCVASGESADRQLFDSKENFFHPMSDYETISTCQKSFVVDRCMHATTKAKCRDCLLRCCDASLKDGICYDCRDDKTTEESFCAPLR